MIRRVRRAFGYVLLALLAAVVMAALAAGYLLGTASGARQLLSWAVPAVPGTLHYERVEGAVLRTLTVEGIDWQQGDLRAEIARLSIAADLLPLLAKGLIEVESLRAEGLRIYLPPGTERADPGPPKIAIPAIPETVLPIGVVLHDVVLSALEIHTAPTGGEAPGVQRIERIELAARAFRSDIDIDRLVIAAPTWGVEARGNAALRPAMPLKLNVAWRLRFGEADGERAEGTLSVSGNRQGYAVDHALSAPYVVTTRGTIRPGPDDTAVDISSRIEAATALLGGRQIGTRGATLDLTGTLGAWRARLDGGFDVPETGPIDLLLEASGDLRAASIASAVVDRPAGGRLTVSGDIGYGAGVSWNVEFDAEALPLALADPALEGLLSATGRTDGALAPALSVSVSMPTLEGQLRGRVIAGRASVVYRGGELSITDTELGIGNNTLRANGRIGTTLDLALAANAPVLADVYPGLQGALNVDAILAGTRQAPAVRGTLTAGDLVWQDLAVGQLDVNADIASGAGIVSIRAGQVSAAGQQITSATVELSGSLAEHDIAVATALAPFNEISAVLRGGWQAQAWRGEISSLALALPPPAGAEQDIRIATTDAAPLTAAAAGVELGTLCLRDVAPGTAAPASLCLSGEAAGSDVDAAYRISDVPLGWLPVPLPSGGVLEGALRSSGEITARDGALASVFEASVGRARATFFPGTERQEVIPIDQFTLSGQLDSGALTATGELRFSDEAELRGDLALADIGAADSPLEGSLVLRVDDVAKIDPLVAGIDVLGGRLGGNLTLSGTRSRPLTEGEATLAGGQLRVPDLGITLDTLGLAVNSGRGGVLRYSGSAVSGGGKLRIEGETSLRPETRFDTRLSINGDRVLLVNLPDMRALADAELSVVLEDKRYAVTGQVAVPEADVTVRDLPTSAVQIADDAVVHRGNRPGPGDRKRDDALLGTIDIEATVGDRVHLSGFGLDTRLSGALTLRQAVRGPILGSGQLRLLDAKYEAYGQKLSVERGILTFNGPLSTPFLDVRATREVDSTEVGIDITGTPDALQSTLYSDPTLPQAEILSLLLTGRSLSQANASEGSALSNAALGLGLKQAGNIAATIGQTVGLDTLSIDGGAGDGRLLAGKNLSENLYVQYAYGLFDQVSSVLLRLKLSSRLSLETNSGESQSVDLIYEVGNIRL